MTLYDDIAAAIVPLLPDFAVDGTTDWIIVRSSATTRIPAVNGVVSGAVMRNRVDAAALALPQTTVFTAPWLFMGAIGQDMLPEDTLVSDDRAFVIVGQVQTDLAMLVVPLREANNPLRPAPLRLLRQGARLGIRQGM